jgi:hypothetical protein
MYEEEAGQSLLVSMRLSLLLLLDQHLDQFLLDPAESV